MTLKGYAIYAANVNFDITKLPRSKKKGAERNYLYCVCIYFVSFITRTTTTKAQKPENEKKKVMGTSNFPGENKKKK